MIAKKLRAAIAATVIAVLLPISSAAAMPAGGERQASDSGFVAAVESLASSIWHFCCQALAKNGVSMNPDGIK